MRVPCLLVSFIVRGKLLDTETLEGLSGAALAGRTLTNGQESAVEVAFRLDGTPTFPLTAEDGSFRIRFFVSPRCSELRDPGFVPPEFPNPDQLSIIVVRDACEQTFLIDINEDAVVDLSFPDDVIELKDPILVPPCED